MVWYNSISSDVMIIGQAMIHAMSVGVESHTYCCTLLASHSLPSRPLSPHFQLKGRCAHEIITAIISVS